MVVVSLAYWMASGWAWAWAGFSPIPRMDAPAAPPVTLRKPRLLSFIFCSFPEQEIHDK
jgi:hypothetical protein